MHVQIDALLRRSAWTFNLSGYIQFIKRVFQGYIDLKITIIFEIYSSTKLKKWLQKVVQINHKKRDKSVINLADKLKVLYVLRSGGKVTVVAKRFKC